MFILLKRKLKNKGGAQKKSWVLEPVTELYVAGRAPRIMKKVIIGSENKLMDNSLRRVRLP